MAKEQAQKNQAQTIGLRNAVHPSIHFDTDGLSERRSYCKFKSSIRIPGFFYNGKAPAKFERADWRYPCESQTIGITYIAYTGGLFLIPYIAGIHKGENAQHAVKASFWQRNADFRIHQRAFCAANGDLSVFILGAERSRFIAAHRANSARVVIFENGERFTGQAASVTQFAIQAQHEPARECIIVLLLKIDLIVLGAGNRQAQLKIGPRQSAAAWNGRMIACIARPANR